MADFVGLLRKTIEAQSHMTPVLRQRIYDRARATVERKLLDSNAPAEVIELQRIVLQKAIDEVEASYQAEEAAALAADASPPIDAPPPVMSFEPTVLPEEETDNAFERRSFHEENDGNDSVFSSSAPVEEQGASLHISPVDNSSSGDAADFHNERVELSGVARRSLNDADFNPPPVSSLSFGGQPVKIPSFGGPRVEEREFGADIQKADVEEPAVEEPKKETLAEAKTALSPDPAELTREERSAFSFFDQIRQKERENNKAAGITDDFQSFGMSESVKTNDDESYLSSSQTRIDDVEFEEVPGFLTRRQEDLASTARVEESRERGGALGVDTSDHGFSPFEDDPLKGLVDPQSAAERVREELKQNLPSLATLVNADKDVTHNSMVAAGHAREQAERNRLASEREARERIEQDRLAREQAEGDRQRERLSREMLGEELDENFEPEHIRKERLERERIRVEQERLAREQAEREHDRFEQIRLEQEQERLEQERFARAQAERERLEKERLAREQAERERLARELAQQEQLEQELAKQEKLEQERLEQERLEQERLEQERAEQERLVKERAEYERLEQERAEQERLVKERAEYERLEQERLEQERLEQERLEQERLEQERAEQERLVKERAEYERLEQERLEQERLEQERFATEQALRDRLAREASEQQEAARAAIERDRLAREQAARENEAAREKFEQDYIARDAAEQIVDAVAQVTAELDTENLSKPEPVAKLASDHAIETQLGDEASKLAADYVEKHESGGNAEQKHVPQSAVPAPAVSVVTTAAMVPMPPITAQVASTLSKVDPVADDASNHHAAGGQPMLPPTMSQKSTQPTVAPYPINLPEVAKPGQSSAPTEAALTRASHEAAPSGEVHDTTTPVVVSVEPTPPIEADIFGDVVKRPIETNFANLPESESTRQPSLSDKQDIGSEYDLVSDIFAQAAKREKTRMGYKRTLIGLLVAAIVIGLLAVVLWLFIGFLRDDAQDKDAATNGTETSQKAERSQKLTQRLLPDGRETNPGPAVGENTPIEGTSSAQASAPVPRVANAAFYEARTSILPESANTGSVAWTLLREKSENDGLDELAIRGDVKIPGKDISLRLTIRRNTDESFPADYLMELVFVVPENFDGGAISDIAQMQFKATEQSTSQQLAGTVPAKLDDNIFMIAIRAPKPMLERNLSMMRQLPWLKLPVMYKSGRVAEFSFEKGDYGDSVFKQVIEDWSMRESWAPPTNGQPQADAPAEGEATDEPMDANQ